MFNDAALEPATGRSAAAASTWEVLTTSGPTLNASERHSVIETARAAWAGAGPVASDPLREAAHWTAVDAGGLNADAVADFEARGLDRYRYLEVVGVVARLSNVDFYARGLGASLPELPLDDGSAPTGNVIPIDDPRVRADVGWVPSVGRPAAPQWLDVFPDEAADLVSTHAAMYLDFASPSPAIADPTYVDELSRAQIEYVAARTSYLNECFF